MPKALAKSVFSALIVFPFLTACTSVTHRGQDEFQRAFDVGNFEAASNVYTDILKQDEVAANANLAEDEKPQKLELEFFQSLNTGTASFIAAHPKKANKYFDRSLSLIKKEQTDDYDPKYYERIMLNTYSGLNSWRSKNINDARVDFNRAHQSQARAIEENKKKISELEGEARDKNLEQSLTEAKQKAKEVTPDFKDLKAYKNFANPYTSYLSGLFLVLNKTNSSDLENGINYLKRVKSMMPNNPYVSKDIAMAERLAKGIPMVPTVWVFYEGGLAPNMDILKIQIPLYFGSGFKIASMALPKLAPNPMAYNNILIKTTGDEPIKTELMTNMDAIVEVELEERMPWETAKAILWMSVNLLAQEGAQQAFRGNNSAFGLIAALIISQITNPVETRVWSSLPKIIETARFNMPQDRKIRLATTEGAFLSDTITFKKDTKYAIVYLRVPSKGASPAVLVSEFNK